MTRAGGIRARDACALREEDGEGKGKRVGANCGGDRGWSATRVRHPHTVREEQHRAGADCGKAVARARCGMRRLSMGKRREVRARVSTTSGF
jgi:hypothetical protein